MKCHKHENHLVPQNAMYWHDVERQHQVVVEQQNSRDEDVSMSMWAKQLETNMGLDSMNSRVRVFQNGSCYSNVA